MKYDGPFEVLQKLNPVSYQLRMPASYGMHPVINITHLEKYNKSPMEFGDWLSKSLDLEAIGPEWDKWLIARKLKNASEVLER